MLGYVVIVLIALWVLLFAYVRYLRWRRARGSKPEVAEARPQREIRGPKSIDPGELDTITLVVGESERDALIPDVKGGGPRPLLLCFHGGLGNPERFAETSDLAARGLAWGFLPVFPGAPKGWVDGRPERGDSTEDLEFVDLLVEHLSSENLIDPARIYAIGVSNGGMFVQHLSTERPGLLVGGTSVLASIPTAVAEKTHAGPPMPFVLACDLGDGVMPFEGGEIMSAPGLGVGGFVVPVQEARAIWVDRNHAANARRPKHVDGPGGFWADIYDHPSGPQGAPVRYVEVYGMGHRWPRWPAAGGIPTVNIADVALDFFASEAVQAFAARAERGNYLVARSGRGND